MLFSKKLILISIVVALNIVNVEAGTSEEELIRRATELSTRIMPTRLKYHQLKQMWTKGDKYCLGKPRMGEGAYTGIYVQELLNKVPDDGICVFNTDIKPSPFIINRTNLKR